MSSLQDVQLAFKRYLFNEDNDIASRIVNTPGFDSHQRLSIYGNAYRSRLIEALSIDYSALHNLLGNDEFHQLGLDYIEFYPSTYYSLRWFGQNLPHFLKTDETYKNRVWLGELAEFEWTFVNAFDAKDVKIVEIDDAAQIPPDSWPGLKITLHPSVYWITCSWNCFAIWKAIKNASEIPVPQQLQDPVSFLIWRQGLDTRYRSIEPDEKVALEAVQEGNNFAELCEELVVYLRPEETALRAASLLKTWLAEGLVGELSIE